ncbi:MAG: type II secretion system protein [bacterium]|nr:type II secretion system protein [bacterium]MDZ4299731.1 type II secretion system protein [Candidatus Sungbacteria bacterium]
MLMSTQQFRKKSGFTLIETVVAAGLIAGALTLPVALITSSLTATRTTKNNLIAANLAQEGIELVRTVRENNVLCLDALDGGGNPMNGWDRSSDGNGNLFDVNGQIADATFWENSDCHRMGGPLPLSNPHIGTKLNNAQVDCATLPLRVNANGSYGYQTGANTIFFRCVNVTHPATGETDGIFTIDKSDMLDVISTVTWNDGVTPHSIQLQERLYNWR